MSNATSLAPLGGHATVTLRPTTVSRNHRAARMPAHAAATDPPLHSRAHLVKWPLRGALSLWTPHSGTVIMPGQMHHQLELVGETATLYITGSLGRDQVETLIGVCAAVPARARTLRLDLHGLGQLSAESMDAVRQLLCFWRDTRHGEFRLTTSHMLATLHAVTAPRASARTDWYPPRMNEALAATYL